jgi:hypothetical protein
MHDALTGFDRIEFRRSDAEYGYFGGHGSAASVEVLINGVELTRLWINEDDGGVLALEAKDAGADLDGPNIRKWRTTSRRMKTDYSRNQALWLSRGSDPSQLLPST